VPALIDVTVESRAPREAVWSLLADTGSWARWAPFADATLESEGSPEREGVGAVRRFRRDRRTTRERVVVFEPPGRLEYELLSGIPIRDYRAVVLLEPVDGGTRIRWSSTFRGRFPVPAGLVRPKLEQFVRQTAEALARAAEAAQTARAAAGPPA
jgi:uncharacterized protein YndB with AHSA1/START domain